MAEKTVRYAWIDVLKAFAIFFIIYSHLGSNPLSVYIFTFMVNIFFFASGLTSRSGLQKPFREFVTGRFMRLVVPYFSFGILAIVVKLFIDTSEAFSMTGMIKQLLYACRLNTFAVTLWFLPCLFVMGIYYYAVAKFVKNKWVRFAVCAAVSVCFRIFSEGNMLPWGIDNAVRYLIYYAAGDALADFFNGLSASPRLIFSRKWPLVLFAGSVLPAYIQYGYGVEFIPQLMGLPLVYITYALFGGIYALNNIFMFSVIAIFMQQVKGLQQLGRQSLAVCCLELPVNRFVLYGFSTLGLQPSLGTHGNLLILAVIFILAALQAAKFIERYFPFMLGVVPKPSESGQQKA